MLDRGEKVTVNGVDYEIKALKMSTRWLISECINKMEIAEKDTINIIESMFTDIPLLVRIITLAVLRDRDKIEDVQLYNKTYDALMECTNMQEYLDAITVIIRKLDVEWFFFTQEAVKSINILPSKVGFRQKSEKSQAQEYTMHQPTLEKSQE